MALLVSPLIFQVSVPVYAGRMEDFYRVSVERSIIDFEPYGLFRIMGSFATRDGGFLYKSEDYSPGHFLVKVDAAGNQVRKTSLGNAEGWKDLTLRGATSDNGLVLTGRRTTPSGTSSSESYFVKTDSLGRELWRKSYTAIPQLELAGVKETSDFGFFIFGKAWTTTTRYHDPILIRTDSRGNELWRQMYPGPSFEEVTDAYEKPDGGFLLCGTSGDEFLMLRTDKNGSELWRKTEINRRSQAVLEASNRDLVAYSQSGVLSKRNESGDVFWSKAFPESYASSIVEKPDKGFLINGFELGDQPESGPKLLSVDSLGNIQWVKDEFGDEGTRTWTRLFGLSTATQGGFFYFTEKLPIATLEPYTRLKKIEPLFRFLSPPSTVVPGEPASIAWSLTNNSDTVQHLIFSSQIVHSGMLLPRADSALEYRVYTAQPHSEIRDSAVYRVPSDWEADGGFEYRGLFKNNESDAVYACAFSAKVDFVEMELISETRVLRKLDTLRASAIIRNVSKTKTLHDLNFAVNVMKQDSSLAPDSAATGSPYLDPVTAFTLVPGGSRTIPIRFAIPADWNSRINQLQGNLISTRDPGGKRRVSLKFVGED